jgi:probable phosphoglycerate mutase
MTGELCIVRHAEASGHEDDDPGLSERGRAQAAALGARLARGPVAQVLHGPRRRAAETAADLADFLPGISVTGSALLDDRTAVPSPGRRADYPERYQLWLDAVPPDERDEDGEQMSAAFHELGERARAGDGALVLVTHAFVVGWFVREVLDGPAAQWLRLVPSNAGLTVVRWRADGTAVLAGFNDTGHLP